MRRPLAFLALLPALGAPGAAQTTLLELFGDAAGDRFGHAVAGIGDADGDGVGDWAIGSPFHDAGGTDAGRVRVYSGATAAVLHTFVGDNPGDRLGQAVAGAGDVNRDGFMDVVAGAPENDNNGTSSGAAKVFSGVDGALLYVFNGPSPNAQFGWAVSTAGDVNGDSHADVLIGAPGSSTGAGAWVHSGIDGGVLVSLQGDSPFDAFGRAVHGGADVDGDGVPDVVVGAPLDDDNGGSCGMLRAYSAGQGWSPIVTRYGDAAGDFLGASVAILGDVDGDGFADLAGGSPGSDLAATDAGAVVVVSGATHLVRFTRAGGGANEGFGGALAAPGDVDGDGLADVLVGAPLADPPATDAGTAWALVGFDGTVLAVVRGSGSGDALGTAVGGIGDRTGDGRADLIVGLPGDDDFGADSGSVRVVDAFVDCDGNGVHDGTEIASGAGGDCDGNLVLDACDIAAGRFADCDSDLVPDVCELASGAELDCNANGVPDACDVAAGTSTDCDADGVPDECQVPGLAFEASSPVFTPLLGAVTHAWTVPLPPPPASDVRLAFRAVGDLAFSNEWVTVRLNGTSVGRAFRTGAATCLAGEQADQLVVPAATFLSLTSGGDAAFELDPSAAVNACTGSRIEVTMTYARLPADCNGNGVPDPCEIVTGAAADGDGDGVLDECEGIDVYCVAAPNSTGAPAQIFAGGTPSVAANDLVLGALSLPSLVNGLFIYAAAPGYTPLGNGFLCLDPTVQGFINRLPFEASNGAGTMTHALDVTAPPTPESLITPGSTWYFSCWFRDPPAGGAGFNFSNGLQVLFVP